MKYSFKSVDGFRLNSSLAKVKREVVSKARRTVPKIVREDGTTSPGWLFLLRCQTGIGKTYASAAFILDELIDVAKKSYMPNMNDAADSAAEFFNWASAITGFENAKRNPAAIASIRLKNLNDGKFWDNEKSTYLSFMDDLVAKCDDVKNIIFESAASDGIKTTADKLCSKVSDIANRDIDRKPIIAITDTGDNIKGFHDELIRTHIDGDGRLDDFQRRFLKSQVMLIKANRDHIADVFEKTVKPLVENHFSHMDTLNYCLDECERRHKLLGNDPVTKADFGKACDEINREIVSAYRQYVKQCEQSGKEIDKEIEKEVTKIFPATRFVNGDATAMFMTTQKYLNAITHSKGRFNFQNDYQKHLLFIDEVDKQEGVISKTIIGGRSYKIIDGFRAAHEAATSYKLGNTPRYDGVEEIMQPAIDKVIEVACSDFAPENSWNVDDNLITPDPIQTFSSHGNLAAMMVNGLIGGKSNESKWVNATPAHVKNAVHLITAVDRDESGDSDDSALLIKSINEMGFAYNMFLGCIKKATYKIYGNATAHDAKRASLTGAIQSLIKYYGLKSISADIWDYITRADGSKVNLDTTPVIDNGFHISGFNYTRVTREDASEDSVEFQQFRLPMSASGVLMGIVCSGAEVIGISATANAKTVIHNFDYNGMKRHLGKRFIEMTESQEHRVHEEYCQKRNYVGHGIKLNTVFTQSWHKHLADVYGGSISSMSAAVAATFDNGYDQSSLDNRISQLSRILQAIKHFIDQEGSRYMLCLCSRGVGGKAEEKAIIEKAVEQYSRDGEKPELFVNMNAEAMRSGCFDDAIDVLANSGTKKVIILSSFQSLGAGKNPQYTPKTEEDKKSLIKVDDTRVCIPKKKADIDSLYIDLPTSMFPFGESTSRNVDTNTRLTLFYNLMSLKEAGVIDAKKAKQFVLSAMQSKRRDETRSQFIAAYNSKNSNGSTFENSSDYIAAVIKYIEQAVGRMSRSSFKRKFINIYADYNLVDIISRDTRGHDLLSHEYIALMTEAKRVASDDCLDSVLTVTSDLDDMIRAAYDANIKANDKIMRQVKTINSNTRYDYFTDKEIVCAASDALDGVVAAIEGMSNPIFEDIANELDECSVKAGGIRQANDISYVVKKCIGPEKHNVENIRSMVVENVKRISEEIRRKTIESVERERSKRRAKSDAIVKRWDDLRAFVLRNPTLNSENDIPPELLGIYIRVPDDSAAVVAYKYSGTPDNPVNGRPDYSSIRKYRFFDGIENARYVSAEAADLEHISKNTAVRMHFEKYGFATTWKPGKYMMSPIVFTNIYRAAVSEQACEALLVNEGFRWEPMPKGLEEKLDGIIVDKKTGKKALVDIKFWRMSRMLKSGAAAKIEKVTEITGINRVIYMNMLNMDGNADIYFTDQNSVQTFTDKDIVMVIPGIMSSEKPEVISGRINRIRKFINN